MAGLEPDLQRLHVEDLLLKGLDLELEMLPLRDDLLILPFRLLNDLIRLLDLVRQPLLLAHELDAPLLGLPQLLRQPLPLLGCLLHHCFHPLFLFY